MQIKSKDHIVLTADRPTGRLHLGHYVGSLKNRLILQEEYQCLIMIADIQALSDNFDNPKKIHDNVIEVLKDYLAVGLDPNKCIFFLQSAVHELFELTGYYMNLVTVARLERNPTVKEELKHKSFCESITAGFLCYPVSQAADITAFKATLVPVGADQLPMLELSNEIVRRFNRIYNTDILKESEAILSNAQRLIGIDGKNKAGKSLNNAIFLSDSGEVIKSKIWQMYTDPDHIKISDPGKVKGNVVFTYLDAFFEDKTELDSLKKKYKKGGVGDAVVKSLLNETLQALIRPIREKRTLLKNDIIDILFEGSKKAKITASKTLTEVRHAIGMVFTSSSN
ncbi:MAG: tryptophan--tRNA ligase [Holosporales bacterium]|jgi:tryptophanyl-tRNA synthetase|nr:tryptophan--tRNA ligase [Holosporales bacterium]